MNDDIGLSCKPFCEGTCGSNNPNSIDQMMRDYGRVQSFEKNHILVRFQENLCSFWRIESGWVRLMRVTPDGNEMITGLLTEGETFGEGAFFGGTLSPYTAEVITPTATLTCIYRPHLGDIWTLPSPLLQELSSLFYSRMNRFQLQWEHLLALTAQQRLGCFLLDLLGQARKKNPSVTTLDLAFEKHILANYLGMKPETFSRSVKQLVTVGVHIQGSHIEFHDVPALTQFVCDSCSNLGLCPSSLLSGT